MDQKFLPYILSLGVTALALIAQLFYPLSSGITLAIVAIGLIPFVLSIKSAVQKRAIPLELPAVLTVLALLALQHEIFALFFLVLILLGQLFKAYALSRVQTSIEQISHRLPHTAFIASGSATKEVPIAAIKLNDIVILKSGSRAPVDGILLDNNGIFDESVTTGESKPVKKSVNDRVLAGSINLADYARIKALTTSNRSTLAQIQHMVTEAQAQSSPLSQIVQKYVEATLIFAALAVIALYLVQHDILQALALWVGLVPIIFVLIVPLATTLSISIFARKGILIKSAEALEAVGYITVIAFDKTGTLTNGTPEVVDIKPAAHFTAHDVLRLAASIDAYSEHTLARAVLKKAQEEKIDLIQVNHINIFQSQGSSGQSSEGIIIEGNLKLLQEQGIVFDSELLAEVKAQELEGKSVSFIALNHIPVGAILLSDTPRPYVQDTLQWLKRVNIKTLMISGDNATVAQKIASELGIAQVYADVLPHQKVEVIKKLKKSGERVMMVGDGINDAPALAAADVGVAMGLRGIDITLQSAEIILVDDDLAKIPALITGSRTLLKIVKEDLIFATIMHGLVTCLVVSRKIGIVETAILHQINSFSYLLTRYASRD